MFVNFSQKDPVVVALEKTFGGQHPCELCKAVQEGKQSERKQQMQQPQVKLDLLLTRNVSMLFPPPPFSVLAARPEAAPARIESPPTPPPRLA